MWSYRAWSEISVRLKRSRGSTTIVTAATDGTDCEFTLLVPVWPSAGETPLNAPCVQRVGGNVASVIGATTEVNEPGGLASRRVRSQAAPDIQAI